MCVAAKLPKFPGLIKFLLLRQIMDAYLYKEQLRDECLYREKKVVDLLQNSYQRARKVQR